MQKYLFSIYMLGIQYIITWIFIYLMWRRRRAADCCLSLYLAGLMRPTTAKQQSDRRHDNHHKLKWAHIVVCELGLSRHTQCLIITNNDDQPICSKLDYAVGEITWCVFSNFNPSREFTHKYKSQFGFVCRRRLLWLPTDWELTQVPSWSSRRVQTPRHRSMVRLLSRYGWALYDDDDGGQLRAH